MTDAWVWLVHVAESAWALLGLLWGLVASVPSEFGIEGVVFCGSFLALLFDGEMILTAAYVHWKKHKRVPALDWPEAIVLGLSIAVSLAAVGYVTYHALRMALMVAAAFFLATSIKRRKKARADGI